MLFTKLNWFIGSCIWIFPILLVTKNIFISYSFLHPFYFTNIMGKKGASRKHFMGVNNKSLSRVLKLFKSISIVKLRKLLILWFLYVWRAVRFFFTKVHVAQMEASNLLSYSCRRPLSSLESRDKKIKGEFRITLSISLKQIIDELMQRCVSPTLCILMRNDKILFQMKTRRKKKLSRQKSLCPWKILLLSLMCDKSFASIGMGTFYTILQTHSL